VRGPSTTKQICKSNENWFVDSVAVLGADSKASPGKRFSRPYLEKPHHQKGLVECLNV
jgi:hypothetical protein